MRVLAFALMGLLCCNASLFAHDPLPWPSFRHDAHNSGTSSIVPHYNGKKPWRFKTDKGIFSTPVIDHLERIYFGSADKNFYVLHPDGHLLYQFPTGEIIDSAATLTVEDNQLYASFGAGDGFLYHIRMDEHPTVAWRFDASRHLSSRNIGYNWFEGNVVAGPNGTLYAGTTNWMYYALDPSTGALKWSLETDNMNWSAGAFAKNQDIFWTSLDGKIRRVSPKGEEIWRKHTWGFIAASVALDSAGNAYVGSSDHTFYALDENGDTRWTFKAADHIYASAAVADDAVYITGADGFLYKFSHSGRLFWKFDTDSVIRSSPAVGPKPSSESGEIIYFGAANGKVYAINSDGSFRWSYDTSLDTPSLGDRNDLNSSIALGKNGLYVGGEHGYLWHIPYDYPLHHHDTRTQISIAKTKDRATVRFVSAGGNKLGSSLSDVSLAQVLILELTVRQNGERIDAGINSGVLTGSNLSDVVHITPHQQVLIEKSADGRYLFLRPVDHWQPHTHYDIEVKGDYVWNGLSFGALDTGVWGNQGQFSDRLSFTTESVASTDPFANEEGTFFAIRRLAIPYPSMVTSLNQIGFDSLQFLSSVVETAPDKGGRRKFVTWNIGASVDAKGQLSIDKKTDFMFPMHGSSLGNAYVMRTVGSTFNVANITFPIDFEMRGTLSNSKITKNPSLYGEISMFSDTVYGPLLFLGGLINQRGIMPVAGTFLTQALPSAKWGHPPEAPVPHEVLFSAPSFFQSGSVRVQFEPTHNYLAKDHITGLLLISAQTGEPVYLDYRSNTHETTDAQGCLTAVELILPRNLSVQKDDRLIIMADIYPVFFTRLQ